MHLVALAFCPLDQLEETADASIELTTFPLDADPQTGLSWSLSEPLQVDGLLHCVDPVHGVDLAHGAGEQLGRRHGGTAADQDAGARRHDPLVLGPQLEKQVVGYSSGCLEPRRSACVGLEKIHEALVALDVWSGFVCSQRRRGERACAARPQAST